MSASVGLAYHFLGCTGGPTLLMLHANSLHSQVFRPMLDVLQRHFGIIIAIDAPGQGCSPPWIMQSQEEGSAAAIAEQVYQSIIALGLQGCFVFGHSMGGCLATLIEAAHPGTFAAIYAYEPPLYTPSGAQAEARRGASNAGKVLGMLASKRRARFPSQQAALQSFASKPPFASWHPLSLEEYVRHGTRRPGSSAACSTAPSRVAKGLETAGRTAASRAERGGEATGPAGSGKSMGFDLGGFVRTSARLPPQGLQQHQSLQCGPQHHGQQQCGQQQQQQQQQQSPQCGPDPWVEGEVELCCAPATEGAVYAAFEPPPMLPHHMLPRCPVGWAVGGAAQDVHARLPALGEDGVSDLACACLRRFPGLSHFGPQEDPGAVAQDVLTFFHDVCNCGHGEGAQRRWEVVIQGHPQGRVGAILLVSKL
ncbi:Alpha/Beta hydrolase protein [Dunaliella salina]|uniref:Alpha/Beta hydrolase protein n=1 Tax=Dunaliella salina TaxID=3046 RepID=A0ABQ7GB49_DUNSA|nr:Alpha/Beta hydrolase protein [Dunaliella salina]|eukprot:KAF5831823.1 Alpha/Beta hydrolase protein [Dunaliella salina]